MYEAAHTRSIAQISGTLSMVESSTLPFKQSRSCCCFPSIRCFGVIKQKLRLFTLFSLLVTISGATKAFAGGGDDSVAPSQVSQFDSEKTVMQALELLKSNKRGDRVFAWGAISSGLQVARLGSSTVAAKTMNEIELKAVSEASKGSNRALTSLYLLDATRRRGAFSSPLSDSPTTEQKTRFVAAALAEYRDTVPFPTTNMDAFTGKPTNAQVATLFLLQLGPGVLNHPAMSYLRHVPDGTCDPDLVPAIFLARAKPVRDAMHDSAWNLRLLQFLNACALAHLDITTSAAAMRATAEDASYVLLSELQNDTFDSILKQVAVQRTTQTTPVADRTVQISVRPSTLTGTFPVLNTYPFPGHWSDATCTASSSPLIPVHTRFPGNEYAPNLWKDTYSCFQWSNFYCGSCFGPDTRTTVAKDTADVVTSLLGVEHRTYRPKRGSDRAKFNIRIGYQPTLSTNWVAVRWKGYAPNVGPIHCTSGCYTDQGIASEPITAWQIFMVVPGASVEFYIEAESNVSELDRWPWYQAADLFQDDLELFGIDSNVAQKMGGLDLISLDTAASSNGLIRYVAATEGALASGGWLAPTGDETDSAALTVSRIALLAKIAALPDTAFPAIATDYKATNYPNVALHERRDFLKLALVALTYRTFEKQAPLLQLQTGLTAGVLPSVRAARKDLDGALEALASLPNDRANRLVKTSAKLLGLDPDHDTSVDDSAHDALIVSVIGASDATAQLDNELSLAQARRCLLLRTMEQRSNPSLPRLEVRPEIATACQQ
jgi:hypothetical protein